MTVALGKSSAESAGQNIPGWKCIVSKLNKGANRRPEGLRENRHNGVTGLRIVVYVGC